MLNLVFRKFQQKSYISDLEFWKKVIFFFFDNYVLFEKQFFIRYWDLVEIEFLIVEYVIIQFI